MTPTFTVFLLGLMALPGLAATAMAQAPAAPGAACPTDVPAVVANTDPASDKVFRRKIYDNYAMSANGTLSAPQRVAVTFERFAVGRPINNKVTVEPGRGAVRYNDAAPPNVPIHPVESSHVVCEQYRSGPDRRRVEGKYECFMSRHNEWSCGSAGPSKITRLP